MIDSGNPIASVAAVTAQHPVKPVAGEVEGQDGDSRSLTPAAARVAAVLRLSRQAASALATAQAFGNQAVDCLLSHGASEAGDGIRDPGGRAAASCRTVVNRNERYLDSAAFAQELVEAQPTFNAAEHLQRGGDACTRWCST